MATTAFSRLEQRVNRAVIRRLSTATADWWPGGHGVGPAVLGIDVVFDRAAIEALGGIVQAEQPVCVAFSPDMPTATRGDGIVINGESYVMKKAAHDNAGLLVVDLLKGTAL